MDIRVTPKSIKELCGTVSYKRGESFYKANKVSFDEYNEDYCEAVVSGAETFYVRVERLAGKTFHATCSCPTIGSFTLSCQHVAAVLLAIYEKNTTTELTASFLNLFEGERTRSMMKQRHFESRVELPLRILLHAVDGEWAVQLHVDNVRVTDMHTFLQAVERGVATSYFDPMHHCFHEVAEAVLQALIEGGRSRGEYCVVLPSAWKRLYKLLQEARAELVVQGEPIEQFARMEGPPPVQFKLNEDGGHYRLHVERFDELTLMPTYYEVLFGATIFALAPDYMERLVELRSMLAGHSSIPIQRDQLGLFMEKVLPRLKRLGYVTLSPKLLEELQEAPLVTKVYLDRLRNRLLASVEFHYGQYVIDPNVGEVHELVVRDYAKENEVLDLMDASGFTKTDGGYFMQNDELEYAFLFEMLPKLEKCAQIYATTAVRIRVVKEQPPIRIRVKAHTERTNWLEFKFEMDGIGDEHIKELLSALEMKQKFYRLPNGALMSLHTRELEEIRRFMAALPNEADDIETTLNMPITDSLKFLELIEAGDVFAPEQSFLKLTESLKQPEKLDFAVPASLEGVLRDYQETGYRWMKQLARYGFGGVLADDMGLGKTLQSIAFIVSELENIRKNKQPALIVCPSAVTYNWLRECATFAPEVNAIVVDGASRVRLQQLRALQDVDVVITSYPLLRRDIASYEQHEFHVIFFDEAQAFKNAATQTARSVKKLRATHKFALTGTPIENALEELWSIYYVVFPHLFGRLEDFSFLQQADIARRVRPFLLRRMKEQVLGELPGKEMTVETSELLPEQKKIYAALLAKLRHDTLKHLDRETFRKNKIRILAGITRLRQVCCHPALFVDGYKGKSAKFEQLKGILEEARLANRRVLVFSQFTQMLKIISQELFEQGRPHFYLDGTTPSEERVELCERFNNGEQDVFLISLKAGGTGLNLTGADTVILYDLWWNPAVEQQAEDRAYRMGQENVVQVIKLLARGTIEEKMHELQHKKRDLIAGVLQENTATEKSLTEEDIREILML